MRWLDEGGSYSHSLGITTGGYMSFAISIAGAGFVFWCTQVLVSPNFWASLAINEPWLIGVKLGAALVTFMVLKAIT